ncbi:MAG: ankyrin repeat domain-containing protein [Jaaginema sp. PMC 1079.18]|nr:ankyrin repeat domain-containing protein [Jaaginema sp. PMC 1080.18]MEC4850030.1 ankyrin repeat domain-containing protein [Jaaginema sp. PMC 1079.18]MEC4867440.1 ankyrin repeat domain-containing protein [Jaaginema sp. PMC 1078.18]
MSILTLRHVSFALFGFAGGATVVFNLLRSFNFFNLLKRGVYSDQTIFYNTFYELLFGIPIGGLLGIGFALFLLNKNVKFVHLIISISFGIFVTLFLTETLDRQIRPPLVRAAQYNYFFQIQTAIQIGNDLNFKDINGNTALIEASRKGNFSIVKALIQAGADVNAVNNWGSSALAYTVSAGDYEINIIKALIEAGADVNVTNSSGNTPLMTTLRFGINNTKTVKALIQAGADVNAINNRGSTPLEIATTENQDNVVDILREAGAE